MPDDISTSLLYANRFKFARTKKKVILLTLNVKASDFEIELKSGYGDEMCK